MLEDSCKNTAPESVKLFLHRPSLIVNINSDFFLYSFSPSPTNQTPTLLHTPGGGIFNKCLRVCEWKEWMKWTNGWRRGVGGNVNERFSHLTSQLICPWCGLSPPLPPALPCSRFHSLRRDLRQHWTDYIVIGWINTRKRGRATEITLYMWVDGCGFMGNQRLNELNWEVTMNLIMVNGPIHCHRKEQQRQSHERGYNS